MIFTSEMFRAELGFFCWKNFKKKGTNCFTQWVWWNMYLRIQFWNFLALNELISNKAIDQQAALTRHNIDDVHTINIRTVGSWYRLSTFLNRIKVDYGQLGQINMHYTRFLPERKLH